MDRKKILPLFLLIFISCSQNKEKIAQQQTSMAIKKSLGFLENITPQQLVKLIKYDKNIYIIDIRNQNSNWRKCRLIGKFHAINSTLIYQKPNILPENKTIVILSKDGSNGMKLGKSLIQNNDITIYNLRGGMEAYWKWRENLIRNSKYIYDDTIDVLDLYGEDFGC